jgi:putative membrane protein
VAGIEVMIGLDKAPRPVDGEGDRSVGQEEVSREAGGILEEEGPVETGRHLTLTAVERERVEQAVQAAERTTSAEVVPMIVAQSGLYREARHRAGLTSAVLVLAILLTVEAAWLPWGWHAANAAWLLLATIAAYGLGTWMGSFAPIIRLFTSTDRMRHKVKLRTERAFASQGIARTRDRTGVLILLSLLERQVYILADQALYDRIPAGILTDIVAVMVERIKAGDVVGGLCRGIERCGLVLAQYYPSRPGDNPDELSNQLIQEP